MTDSNSSIPLGDASVVRIPERRLSVRELRVATSLRRLDPSLEDLYRLALALDFEPGRAGLGGLVGHAGRELTNGVLNRLVGYTQATREERESLVTEGDTQGDHRVVMGKALQRDPDHGTVKYWHALHHDFVRGSHFKGMAANAGRVVQALDGLTAVFDALLGPYFDVEADLTKTIAKPNPTEADISRVVAALGNDQLRWHCFKHLNGPGWLAGLERRGCFRNPPVIRRFEDGSWSITAWPEGEYLVRVAADRPDEVTAILKRIPSSNDNPAVWDVVSKALLVQTGTSAVSLGSLLAKGICSQPHVVFADGIVEAVKYLAANGHHSVALRVTKNLCALTVASGSSAASLRFREPPIFKRLWHHDVDDILKPVVESLTDAAPREAVEWLTRLLRSALAMTEHPDGANEARHASHSYWCTRLDGTDHDSDTRVIIARSLAKAAWKYALSSQRGASWVLVRFRREKHDIFRRLWLHTLARCRPRSSSTVSAWLRSRASLLDAPRSREAGDLLRMRICDASPAAQAAFEARLRRGPSKRALSRLLRTAKEWKDVTSEAEERQNWQVRLLRRFDASLPTFLQPFAIEIGYVAKERSAEEEGLGEDGVYSGGAHWVGDRSPVTLDELKAMGGSDVAVLLTGWTAKPDELGRMSRHGLVNAIRELVKSDTARLLGLTRELRRVPVNVDAINVVAQAGREVAQSLAPAEVVELSEFAKWAAGELEIESAVEVPARNARETFEAAHACIWLLQDLAPRATTAEAAAAVFTAVDAWLVQPLVWSAPGVSEQEDQERLDIDSLNTPQGAIAHLVIATGRCAYNNALSGTENPQRREQVAATQRAAAELAPRLNFLVQKAQGAKAACASLGHELAAIQFFVPEWLAANRHQLFAVKTGETKLAVTWLGYLLHGRVSETVFVEFRSEYLSAVRALPSLPRGKRHSIQERLAEHLIQYVLWGLLRTDDADGLLPEAWAALEPDDVSHAYWAVFRGWSDSTGIPPVEVIDRLVSLWQWRLADLERSDADPKRTLGEANALTWFCITPHVPLDAMLELGTRTVRMADAEQAASMTIWDVLAKLPDDTADRIWPLARATIDAELRGKYPRLFAQHTGPVLAKIGATASASVRAEVQALVHDLGARGFTEFRPYLPKVD